jgi:hypothetical protein
VNQGAIRRIVVALTGLVAVTVLGTVGYFALGFTFRGAAQTVTTVATVGFARSGR